MSPLKSLLQRIGLWQFFAMIAASLTLFYFETLYLAEYYAYNGWSPMEWTAKTLRPENFTHDFANGVENYSHSMIMWVYPLAEKYLQIPALSTTYLMILVEIFATVSLFAILYHFLIRKTTSFDKFVFLILAIFILASHLRHANGARFSQPFWGGLYYVHADFIRIIAVLFILNQKRIWASVLFCLAFAIHPAITLHALIFSSFLLLPRWRQVFFSKDTYIALGLFTAFAGLWTFFNFQSSTIQAAAIPKQMWVDLTRLMSFHWYPNSLDMFWKRAFETTLPLLGFVVLSFYSLIKTDTVWKKSLLWGLASVVLMTVFGWFNAEILQSQTLIKISFQRSSDLLYFFYLPFIFYIFFKSILSGPAILGALCIALLFSVFNLYGFPLIPLLLFCVLHSANDPISEKNKDPRSQVWLYNLFGFLLILVLCLLQRYRSDGPWTEPAVFGDFYFAQVFVIAFVGLKLVGLSSRFKNYAVLAILTVVVGFLGFQWEQRKLMPATEVSFNRDYLNTQLWAQQSTPVDAIFFPDPTILYGWRDFSERSSFGNFREWLHTSWLYNSNLASYKEGLRRFSLLKIDLEPYLRKPIKVSAHSQLNYDIQKRFYRMKPEELTEIASGNNISYLVLQKRHKTISYPWPVAYENDSFLVYKMN